MSDGNLSPSHLNINSEKTPLLHNDHQAPRITIQAPLSEETSTDGKAPCAKYGHEDFLTTSAAHSTQRAKRKLMIACIICLFFLIGEFVGRSTKYHMIG